jgi:hypothetical protein
MNNKTTADFTNHDEWISYVRENIPAAEQPYALAYGRTELFDKFYQARQQTFPVGFAQELARVQTLREPERTNALESLNKRIFVNLTEHLFGPVQTKVVRDRPVNPESPSKRTQHLREHLTERNPNFALWIAYKNVAKADLDEQAWEDYLCQTFGPENENEISFTRGMAELDALLVYFREKDLPLPRYSFDRCCFLHGLRGPERMLQTRALLNTLAAGIESCASA